MNNNHIATIVITGLGLAFQMAGIGWNMYGIKHMLPFCSVIGSSFLAGGTYFLTLSVLTECVDTKGRPLPKRPLKDEGLGITSFYKGVITGLIILQGIYYYLEKTTIIPIPILISIVLDFITIKALDHILNEDTTVTPVLRDFLPILSSIATCTSAVLSTTYTMIDPVIGLIAAVSFCTIASIILDNFVADRVRNKLIDAQKEARSV